MDKLTSEINWREEYSIRADSDKFISEIDSEEKLDRGRDADKLVSKTDLRLKNCLTAKSRTEKHVINELMAHRKMPN